MKNLHDERIDSLVTSAQQAALHGDDGRLATIAEQLAALGKWQLMALIGDVYAQGSPSLSKNPVAAARWYRRAIFESDDSHAHLGLGKLLFDGALGEPRYEAAMEHFKKAREADEPMAAFYIGYIFHFGLGGVSRDVCRAEEEYRVAADKGVPEAFAYLARLQFSRGALWNAIQCVIGFYKATHNFKKVA